MNKVEKRKLFSALDLICIAVVILITVVCFILPFQRSDELIAVVRIKGEVVDRVELSKITDTYEKEYFGDMKVTVEYAPDGVSVISSECPDKLCVHTGKIKNIGASSVCLPAKVSLTIEGKTESADAIAR